MLKPRDISKSIIAHAKEGRIAIKEALLHACDTPEDIIPHLERVKPYFSAAEIEQIFRQAFTKNSRTLITFAASAKEYLPNEELRKQLIEQHKKTPWEFYIHAEEFSELFPKLFFENQFKANPKITTTELFDIFLFYNANIALNAFSQETRTILKTQLSKSRSLDITIGETKDAGFACGGLEQNYHAAIAEQKGICIVNNVLLAKLYHRKTDAKKLFFVATESRMGANGYPIWNNMIYAPTGEQHTEIIHAVTQGHKHTHVEDLVIKPVRPLIGTTSKELLAEYHRIQK